MADKVENTEDLGSPKLVIERERGNINFHLTPMGALTIRVDGDEHGHRLTADELDVLIDIIGDTAE